MFVFVFQIIDTTALLGQNNTQPMRPNKAESTVHLFYYQCFIGAAIFYDKNKLIG